MLQRYWFLVDSARRLVFLWHFVWCFCGNSFGVFAQFAIPCEPLRQRKFKIKLSSQVQAHAFSKTSKQRSQNKNVKRYNVKTTTRTILRKGS